MLRKYQFFCRLFVRLELIQIDMNRIVIGAFLLALTMSAVTVQNLGVDFSPRSELEYVNLLKIMLGRHDEATTLSPALMEFVKNNRNSLGNSYDRVMLAFMVHPPPSDVNHKSEKNVTFEMKGQLVKRMVSETPNIFMITSLPVGQEGMIDNMAEKYKAENKLLHIIRGSADEVRRIQEMLDVEREESRKSPLSRKLQSLTDSSGAYLIKFFFSIAFIFMLLFSVLAILDSEGKKDTLLYAKFLADVNSR